MWVHESPAFWKKTSTGDPVSPRIATSSFPSRSRSATTMSWVPPLPRSWGFHDRPPPVFSYHVVPTTTSTSPSPSMSPTALPDCEAPVGAIVVGAQSGFRYQTIGPFAPLTTRSGLPSPFRSAMSFIHGSGGPDAATTTRCSPMSSVAVAPKGLADPDSSRSTSRISAAAPVRKTATRNHRVRVTRRCGTPAIDTSPEPSTHNR